MLIELFSTSNYARYNVSIAHLFNLHTAIYLQELMNINEKAIKKAKLDGKYFILDREYIKSRTTFTVEEQKEIDDLLISVGVLKKEENNPDALYVDIPFLTSILSSEDENIIDNVKKLVKPKPVKATKTQKIIESLKENIVTTNAELRAAYSEWIDAVYAKDHWMSKTAVVSGQALIDEFSNHNLDIALQVLRIAAINGYRNIEWAINSYKETYRVGYRVPPQISSEEVNKTVELSDEVF